MAGKIQKLMGSMWIPLLVLGALWGGIVVVVNPVGEFMVNDDWSFVKAFHALDSQGRLIATGWGPHRPGGPSLIVHLLWGKLFVGIFGFSLTTLRISVLTLGVLTSVVLLLLLRIAGASSLLSLWGSLTLVANPLFLSQCFTYMTDISFTFFALAAISFLYVGQSQSRQALIVMGMGFSLCATLTRQVGMVIPVGFILACRAHPALRIPSMGRLCLLAFGIVLLPWLAYEVILEWAGSTPITHHQILRNAWYRLMNEGLSGILFSSLTHSLPVIFIYISFLVSPVTALQWDRFLEKRRGKALASVLGMAFLTTELSIVAGIMDPPVGFLRNVITNWSIGPILLKDVYILSIPRLSPIPVTLYYGLVFWALYAGLLPLASRKEGAVPPAGPDDRCRTQRESPRFLKSFCLYTSLSYLSIICLSGFHDRYLIPVCVLMIIWSVNDFHLHATPAARPKTVGALPGLAAFLLMAFFSVAATHDFMELKRHLKRAHDYLLEDLLVNPCHVDGGFEFNGTHCAQDRITPKDGLSWWWVLREDYLVSLGPLEGYEVIRVYPFERYWGRNGAVHILRPRRLGAMLLN